MFCSRCGASNAADAQFCAKCGNSLQQQPVSAPPGVPAWSSGPVPGSYPPVGPPPAKKPPVVLIGCVGCAVIIGAIFVFIVIAALMSKGGSPPSHQPAKQSSASRLAGRHVTLNFKNGRKLDGVVVDATEYGIYTTRVTSSIGGSEFTEPTRAGGRFVILELVVRNDSKEAREISLTQAKLIDTQGNSYSTSSEGETALTMSGDREAEFLLSQLQPGLEKYLKIVFDVPAAKKAFTLRIPHGIFSGGEDGELGVHL